ncbi:hypothetical protein ANRL3_01117 [Anaerolineae bacterium]|nr:hypothetical protein ANRL3_01117 [Anaerolineae bacterium]
MLKRILPFLILLLTACSGGALLDNVSLTPDAITPRAGSANIATTIRYTVTRNADVSIYLIDAQGKRHDFRKDQPRPAGNYDALFTGAIDNRVLPDGKYTVVIEAKDAAQQIAKTEKMLTITNADSTPPQLQGFAVFPDTFTPNQDGISDRVAIRYYLTKPAKVDLYLSDGKQRFEVAEKRTTLNIKDGLSQPGAHESAYDGGLDLLAAPPPVGTDTVIAEAADASGNRTREERALTIKDSGIPRATISNGGVEYAPRGLPSLKIEPTALIVPLGNTLTFTVTVQNIGPVPLRTKGPEPGTPYTTSENFNTKQAYEEPGVWRVGLDSEGNSAGRPYPYRWQIGSTKELTRVVMDGKEYFYLMPGQRVTVSGTLKIVDKPPRVNVYYWVGLIQEDVRIVEDRVEPKLVTIEF